MIAALTTTMNISFPMERKMIHNPRIPERLLLDNQNSVQLRSVACQNVPLIEMSLMRFEGELFSRYTSDPMTILRVCLLLNHLLLRSSSTTQSARVYTSMARGEVYACL